MEKPESHYSIFTTSEAVMLDEEINAQPKMRLIKEIVGCIEEGESLTSIPIFCFA